MKLYRISRPPQQWYDYDTYDAAVVCAHSEEDARSIHPDEIDDIDEDINFPREETWPEDRSTIIVEYLGEAAPSIVRGVICASFNAG